MCTVEICFSLVSLSILKTIVTNKTFTVKSACMDQHTDGPVTGALNQGVVTLIIYAIVIALPVVMKILYRKEGMESLCILLYNYYRAKGKKCTWLNMQLMNEMHSQEPFCDSINQKKCWVKNLTTGKAVTIQHVI